MANPISSFNGQLRAVLLGGLTAGALDLIYAFSVYGARGIAPQRILHSIASGWLGDAAYRGGMASAMLGVLSHFGITCLAATCYVLVIQRNRNLGVHPVLSGVLFGAVMFVVMNYVVVPLSAAVTRPPRGVFFFLGLAVHMVLVGIPIAWFAQRGMRQVTQEAPHSAV
jgi:hypothetical protein